jgi:DNA-binding NtrC family response regulator
MPQQGTILVVDDDRPVAELIAEVLTDEGYRAQLAQDAPSALAAIVAEVPDLVIADLVLPWMSGLELLHAIRARGHADLPVVLMTTAAYRAADLAIHNAAAFLSKPFDLDDLLSCVEQSLRPQLEQREALA